MTTINNSSQASVIRVHSGRTFIQAVKAHNLQANRLHDMAAASPKLTPKTKGVLKDWFKHKPVDEVFSKQRLKQLDKYMKEVFADPLSYGSTPFVDMLYLTIDVSDSTVEKLHTEAKSYSGKLLKKWKSGPPSCIPNNKEFYLRFASFKNKLGGKITLYWGLSEKMRETRSKQRLAKVAFNPARFNAEEIREFFNWLKAVIRKGATKLLKSANVTRADIAMDLFGIPVHYLLANHTAAEILSYHLNMKSKLLVGTQKFGKPESNNSCIYNKQIKYLDKGRAFRILCQLGKMRLSL